MIPLDTPQPPGRVASNGTAKPTLAEIVAAISAAGASRKVIALVVEAFEAIHAAGAAEIEAARAEAAAQMIERRSRDRERKARARRMSAERQARFRAAVRTSEALH